MIMTKVDLLQASNSFWLTSVYGHVDATCHDAFLPEIAASAPPPSEPWLINGDFNMIYESRDKNNLNINRRVMGKFRAAIDAVGLKGMKCKNVCFTWSNERERPTLVSIDKFFCNTS